MDELTLVDPWRIRHPKEFMFTWQRGNPAPVFRRLDYLLVEFVTLDVR